MKKEALYGIVFLLCMGMASAFEVTYNCTDGCLRGTGVTFFVNLSNEGERDINYLTIDLMDTVTLKSLVLYNVSDQKGITVPPHYSVIVVMNTTVPEPNSNGDFVFNPCYITEIPPGARLHQGLYFGMDKAFCYPNQTLPSHECLDKSHCTINETCISNHCVFVNCTECQYIENRQCFDYKCCRPDDCSENETCTAEHECEMLECAGDEQMLNNTCTKLECADDEYASNNECKKLECPEHSVAENGKCIPCKNDEFVLNQSCLKLECADDEQVVNHSCVKLECADDEQIINHACEDITCLFFQDAEGRQCVNNPETIRKALFELALMVAILAVIAMLIKKHHDFHKTKKFIIPSRDKQEVPVKQQETPKSQPEKQVPEQKTEEKNKEKK